MTLITRRTALMGLAVGAVIPLAACAPPPPMPGLRMASGEPGGLYLQFGNLLHDAMRARGTAALNVVPTNGSVANLGLLASGDVSLAIALADTADQYANGFVAIGRVYQNYLQCVVRADRPVQNLSDLVGKPISVGARGSGSSYTTRRLLEIIGATTGLGSPILHEHSLDEALDGLGRGDLDALFWSGGIPTPKIEALSATLPLRLLELADAWPAFSTMHPDLYLATSVPAGVYGSAESVGTIGIPNLLLARPDLPDAMASALVDVLIEDAPRLIPSGTVGLQFLTPASLIDTGRIPLHAAAKQRFREVYA